MARDALSMMRASDLYSLFIFRILYKVGRFTNQGEAIADHLDDTLTAFLEMKYLRPQTDVDIEVPNATLVTNFRYYCDEDKLDGTSRWRHRADPPLEDRPLDYVPQELRPTYQWRIESPYQEYWDPVNKVSMGSTLGCQMDSESAPLRPLSQTYDPTPKRASYPGYPRKLIWATVTVCSFALNPDYPMSIDEFGRDIDYRAVPFVLTRAVNNLGSSAILHAFCHLPPWKLEDVWSPLITHARYQNERTLTWAEAINIASPWESMRNVNNLMFYAVLARLRERGWFLLRGLYAHEVMYHITPAFEMESDAEEM